MFVHMTLVDECQCIVTWHEQMQYQGFGQDLFWKQVKGHTLLVALDLWGRPSSPITTFRFESYSKMKLNDVESSARKMEMEMEMKMKMMPHARTAGSWRSVLRCTPSWILIASYFQVLDSLRDWIRQTTYDLQGAATSLSAEANSHASVFDLALPGSQPVGPSTLSGLLWSTERRKDFPKRSNNTRNSGCTGFWLQCHHKE